MAFARTAFWRQEQPGTGEESLRRRFWRKLTAVIARVPFAEELLAAYYCAFDRATPVSVKATLVGAIAYFVLPIDAIPDVLPILGFTDDAAVLTTALRLVANHVTPEHRTMALEKLTAMLEQARGA
ncbi:MAG TPA: YkvA family protein [Pseudolabrys sp.]